MTRAVPKIEFRGVSKTLGGKRVLAGLDLAIHAGETRVIIGQSGTGKSVLLKHAIGLMAPDAGEVLIDGLSMTAANERGRIALREKFGMLFQGAALFDSLTVFENVAFRQLRARTHTRKELERLVATKLEHVGLAGVEKLKPAELSGGMQKRVGLARAIAADPEIVLYDEPTTGLDPIMADQINELILHLQDALGITSVAVTHDMTSAYKIANSISMLYDGHVIETATPREIRRTRHPIVRQFTRGEADGPITATRTFGSVADTPAARGKGR